MKKKMKQENTSHSLKLKTYIQDIYLSLTFLFQKNVKCIHNINIVDFIYNNDHDREKSIG